MSDQVKSGYSRMHDFIRAYFRSEANAGALTDETIAVAITSAEQWVHDLVMESGVFWAVKTTTVDDIGLDLGSPISSDGRSFSVQTDWEITNAAKIARLKRIPSDSGEGQFVPRVIPYLQDSTSVPYNSESWEEEGTSVDNAFDLRIRIYKWGQPVADGQQLQVTYWWEPEPVQTSWFTETDDDGNMTRAPLFPKKLQEAILAYSLWTLTEITGDMDKRNALRSRIKGGMGIENKVRQYLATASEEPQYVQDTVGSNFYDGVHTL